MIATNPRFVEWLEANGAGSFAMTTIAGRNDRRYHGLLVAALDPPVSRHVLLSKLEESIEFEGETGEINKIELSTNAYPGATYPNGFEYIISAERDPFPRVVFAHGCVQLERTVIVLRHERTVAVRYKLLRGRNVLLTIRPLVAFRPDHELSRANDQINGKKTIRAGCITIKPYAHLPELYFTYSEHGRVLEGGGWYYHFQYEIERRRGLEHSEDLYNHFGLAFSLSEGRELWFCASLDRTGLDNVPSLAQKERERRRALRIFNDPAADALAAAADAFRVERSEYTTIFAGYPWFVDWGRDAMISLPGLCYTTKRFSEARSCLLAFANAAREGMLPNRFADSSGEPEYNTIDATLWMFEAARLLYETGGENSEFILTELYPTLAAAIDTHLRGADHGIFVDDAGFLHGGCGELALTWMDARIDNIPATPRHGRAVEIQALWYNGLRTMQTFAKVNKDEGRARASALVAEKLKTNFTKVFWMESAGYFADVVDATGRRDASLRPNQVFVATVGRDLAPANIIKKALEKVRLELVTPYGLRTLAPSHPDYKRNYAGGPRERDASYHQGTVWPWLLGPFSRAWAANIDKNGARLFLVPLLEYIKKPFPGTLFEVADATEPQAPGGCLAQAWSVAEILRSCVELREN
ncbi:MAG: amylo-alpha-1,6-glucosidase [Planctomycetota bacterium]